MPDFFDDISSFYGTRERNVSGQTLEEFLELYDPYKYKNPCCTTDAVVFSYREKLDSTLTGLKLLLVKRSNHPSIGFWALPGGFTELQEDIDQTARRELEEETGVRGIAVEQFACYGEVRRDPRARIITTAYMALTEESAVTVKAGDDAADAAWFNIRMETEEEHEDTDSIIRTYRLYFENTEQNITVQASVEHRERKGIIKERSFHVIERGAIAADHAAIIAQAITILKSRLCCCSVVS